MKYILKKQQGVALFQVLLIVTILMFLAIFVTNKAKMQVKSAQSITDKQKAMLTVRTVLSKIKFNLLSSPADVLYDQQKWNFYGEEFLIDDVTVSIQDHNGLLFINKRTPVDLVDNIISLANSVDKKNNNSVSSKSFIHWFDEPTNTRIQNLEQFISMGFSWLSAKELWSYITVNPRVLFNPMNVPKTLLPVFFPNNQVGRILALRATGKNYVEIQHEMQTITKLTADESVGYVTGPYYRVKISAKINKSYWNMLYELSIVQQHNGLHVITLSQRPF
ncbi:MAG: hypothetical protein COB35_11710 [Gammaproteobacteria bacterium]|nr:MAG: hypothetical protein COB35_11710 [Gammaproteobacteria bacterium]